MPTVSTRVSDGVAVLMLDNPPVNMGNATMRADLLAAIEGLADVEHVKVVVIATAGAHFYAGSDISEFDGQLAEPQLPAVIAAIESLPMPVVAAIHGFALGGGLELALGCDGRVADRTSRVGLPEVTLGMIPGAGGTVRTTRVVGVPRAIEFVCSAVQVDSETALSMGLLDEVVEDPGVLVEAAAEYGVRIAGKRRLRELAAPAVDAEETAAVEARVLRHARPNVVEAAEMVKVSAQTDGAAALRREREIFNRLRVAPEAVDLRYLFFAKRAAAKALRVNEVARPVRFVGIAGAGTMGSALARAFSAAGTRVAVFDLDASARARLSESVPAVTVTSSLEDLSGVDLLVDAVFEDMSVKQRLLADAERYLREDAVIASNTSYLDLDEMTHNLIHPERFGGLHFFNPADRNPLVEVIRATATDDVTAATLASVVIRMGKTAIPAGRGDGFIANRVYADYRIQAEFLVEDGASPEAVDTAMTDLGFAIGPFAVADMSGLDIAWSRRKRLAPGRNPRQRYVTIADSLCEAGRLGRKTGAGWYRYPDGARRGEPDPVTETLIAEARAAKGISPRPVSSSEIQRRTLASMLCAATMLVSSGVARTASDIDVALTEGFAFPKHLGGPIRHLARWSPGEVIGALAAVHASCPITFAIAEPASFGELADQIAQVLAEVAPR